MMSSPLRSRALRPLLLALLLTAGASPALAQEASCTKDYHSRLRAIETGEFAALKAAGNAIGETDPGLPGRMIFTAPRQGAEPGAQRTRRAAEALARRQGRTSFATNADTRWIAGRIREDLGDYLGQGETPFLCAGVANYLGTLREYAARGAPSPVRLAEDVRDQRLVAARSLAAALGAMAPAPLPRFAPADRPGEPAIAGLRLALDTGLREPPKAEEPVRLAARDAGNTQVSEGQGDPDLPALAETPPFRLADERETLGAINVLVASAERAGFLAPARRGVLGNPSLHSRPVLTRLSHLKARFDQSGIQDARVGPATMQALSDLEALDYLMAAEKGAADPLSAALHGTIDAIEAAHGEACGCSG
ncbi:hypothetical protein [Aureimonas populi]|uniref:Uncharacterized protein n=1 Tax=Aureimonas populi TaxID=1701758 RepID=A0ABW5CJ06_9HYPH|nr:hypothetical protein [Aureimonas populi]